MSGNKKGDRVVQAPPLPICTSTTSGVFVPGCTVIENFITEEEEREFLESDIATDDSEQWKDCTIGRRQQHYGFKFNYFTRMIDFMNKIEPVPGNCIGLVNRIEALLKKTSGNESLPINQITINEYLPGQGISAHVDTVNCIGPDLCSLSLGSDCVMSLLPDGIANSNRDKRTDTNPTSASGILPVSGEDAANDNDAAVICAEKDGNHTDDTGRKYLYLPRRSLLILQGEARYAYTHGIAKRKSDMVDGVLSPRDRRISITFRQVVLPGAIPASNLISTEMEKQHVFDVYDNIAIHWHHTRGKRKVFWSRVKEFLENLPEGSLVADIGCGDGKYFGVTTENNIIMIGCDRSLGLLEALHHSDVGKSPIVEGASAGTVNNEVVKPPLYNQTFCCDAVQVPLKTGMFDATLCIAVLHHLGTVDRRVAVIRELVRVTRPGGFIMIQAWAYEQEESSRHQFSKSKPAVSASARAQKERDASMKDSTATNNAATATSSISNNNNSSSLVTQDVLVPWRLQKCYVQPNKEDTGSAEELQSREHAPEEANTPVDNMDNASLVEETPESLAAKYAEMNMKKKLRKKNIKYSKREREENRKAFEAKQKEDAANGIKKTVPITSVAPSEEPSGVGEDEKHFIYQRYCHVYKKGELEDLCSSVPGVKIVDSGYDRSNWFIVLQKYDVRSDARLVNSNSISKSSGTPILPTGVTAAVPTGLDRVKTSKASVENK